MEGVVSYCSICCGNEICREDDVAVLEFGDLVKVWTVDDDEDYNEGGVLGLGFFPFVSEEFRKGMIERGCEVGVLAGVVMWEAKFYLLKEVFSKKLLKEVFSRKLLKEAT